MDQITPLTDSGKRFQEIARELIPTLRAHADEADVSGTMSQASFDAVVESGFAAAFVPESLGGLGLNSVHDWLVGIATLAEGDGSVAIGISMHLGVSRGMAQGYYQAQAAGKSTAGTEAPLKAIADGNMLICATATERGTDNLHPLTTAVEGEDGWVINGQKMFVTMSPVATHLAMNLRMRNADGDHLATTLMPIETPGVEPQNDWDALGMRGSGSQSVNFSEVKMPTRAVRRLGPWGEWCTQTLINRTLGNFVLVGAFFGIAAHAREIAYANARKQKRLDKPITNNPGVQQTAGELEIEYVRCRALLAQTGRDLDAWLDAAASNPPDFERAHALMQRYQATKWSVNRGAMNIVDKALDLAGGGGYMNHGPLPRLYRDVRAGPFMQPHAATDIRQYVGQVALGIFPKT